MKLIKTNRCSQSTNEADKNIDQQDLNGKGQKLTVFDKLLLSHAF